jgi:hypothetical protein
MGDSRTIRIIRAEIDRRGWRGEQHKCGDHQYRKQTVYNCMDAHADPLLRRLFEAYRIIKCFFTSNFDSSRMISIAARHYLNVPFLKITSPFHLSLIDEHRKGEVHSIRQVSFRRKN